MSMDEEEGWLHEKITLVSSEELVDTLAAVQVRPGRPPHSNEWVVLLRNKLGVTSNGSLVNVGMS